MILPDTERMARWMRPALTRLDAAEFDRCASWVSALSESDADVGSLVLAAHAELPPGRLADLEQLLSEADVGYRPGGKAALLSRLAGCVLMGLMSDDDQDAAVAGLFIRSAAFVGLSPTIAELPGQARLCVTKIGVNVRLRQPLSPISPRRRKPAEKEDTAVVTVADLKDELAIRDTAISALHRRVEQLVRDQDTYASMAEEEVDALWWANSDSSWFSGMAWTGIEPLDRGVLAGLEIGSLLRRAPMAPAHGRMLRSVTATTDADARFGILPIAATVVMRGGARQATEGEPALLRPLTAAAIAYQQANNDDGREHALAEMLHLDATWSKSALEVAEQLLVEKSLEMIA